MLFEIVGNLCEVAGRGFGPTDTHLARVPAFDALSDFIVIHELAAIRGGYALLNFADEPLVIVHHALHGFDHERFAVAALLGSQLRELGLKVGT